MERRWIGWGTLKWVHIGEADKFNYIKDGLNFCML